MLIRRCFAYLFLILFSCTNIYSQEVVANKTIKIVFNNDKGSIKNLMMQSKKYSNLSVFTSESSVFETFIKGNEDLKYSIKSKDSKNIVFEAKNKNLKIIKAFKIQDYSISFKLTIKNISNKKITINPEISAIVLSKISEIDTTFSNFDGKSLKTLSEKDYTGGEINSVGFSKRYTVAFFKSNSPVFKVNLSSSKLKKWKSKKLSIFLPQISLEANEITNNSFNLFTGPKEEKILKVYGYDKILNTGTISKILLYILRFFYGIFHNWGISIIMLTIVIKLILYPLNSKQNKSMAEMQKIQPLVEDIKKRCGKDKEKMNQEVLKLYKEHKINPFGGCLPLLIQLPILFALFTTLRTSIELKGEGFLWIKDLSGPEFFNLSGSHIPVLAIVIAISTYLQMKMQNTNNNPQQANMMMIMPVMMFFLCQALPAGVLIYWFVSNLLAMMQTKLDFGKLGKGVAVSSDAMGKKKEIAKEKLPKNTKTTEKKMKSKRSKKNGKKSD